MNAQFPGNTGGFSGGARGNNQSLNSEKDKSRDTLNKDVFIYVVDNNTEKKLFGDSSLLNFHIYDPVRQAEYEYAHLGNLGSAHRQLVYQPLFHKGFDVGYHNFDLYKTKSADLPYYQLEKAYSDIYFSQTNQEKTSFRARFSKPIAQDMYIGIYYNNINNEGIYTNQVSRANTFAGTLNYQSKNQKYRSFFSFMTNTIEQKENGGGQINDSRFVKNLIAVGRPVNTSTGDARYFERDISYTQFYYLQKIPKPKAQPTKEDSLRTLVTRPADSTNTRSLTQNRFGSNNQNVNQSSNGETANSTGRKFTLKHRLSLKRGTYKYVDVNNLSYYGDFVLDDRGVRNFIRTNQIENEFSIRTFRLAKEKGSVFGRKKKEATQQKDLIELGVSHTYTDLFQEPLDSNINDVFLLEKSILPLRNTYALRLMVTLVEA